MTVLCYHSVEPDWHSPLAVQPAAFADQCAWLARHRSVVPLGEAVERLDATSRLPSGVATLTFDDGFTGVAEHAWPLLRQHRLPATVFLVSNTLTDRGQPVDWVDTVAGFPLRTLTLDQVLDMQSDGIDFQSHSSAHLDLTSLDYPSCVEDLRQSRELLESLLGREVTLLAYPRGRHDSTVRAAARAAGYTHAFTLPERREPTGPYAIPRVGIFRGNTTRTVAVKASRPYLPLRTTAGAGRALRFAARLRRGGG